MLDNAAWDTSPGTSLNIIQKLKAAGVGGYILELSHTDRDFSSSHAAFYASLFTPYQKLCRRINFFTRDPSEIFSTAQNAVDLSRAIEGLQNDYLGFVVLRPLQHAPVGSCVLSAGHLFQGTSEITVTANYRVHLLGAELTVKGTPLTQQDTRIGACAQAAIWCVGRHFHTRHNSRWFSLSDVSEIALKPTDATISQSLPAGSAFLTADNMIRALSGMDRHPVIYHRPANGAWPSPPADIIYKYLDSGIPVIIGLHDQNDQTGHAVVAVGHEFDTNVDLSNIGDSPTLARGIVNFYAMDDQRGPYIKIPVSKNIHSLEINWNIEEHCTFFIVPLPEKVYMTGEISEVLSRDIVKNLIHKRDTFLNHVGFDNYPDDLKDKEFEDNAQFSNKIVTRTYLTHGWKYLSRAVRNNLSDKLKIELLTHRFPRFVWVTEFSKAEDSFNADPCFKRVLAHVVNDATGSQFWSNTIVADVPGIAVTYSYKSNENGPVRSLNIVDTNETKVSYPKKRGLIDFGHCEIT